MMGADRFVVWNSAGFRAGAASTSDKFSFLDSQFPGGAFGVAAILETHHKDDQDYARELGRYGRTHHIFHSPVRLETHSGVIVLINKEFEVVQHSDPVPGRLMGFRVRKSGEILNFSVFYGPQWGKLRKEEISSLFAEFDALHGADERNLILGDFNFSVFDVDKGKGMDGKDRTIKPLWDRVLSMHAMVDPFRSQCPRKRIFSFVGPQGKSRGDRVYISEDGVASLGGLRYIPTPFKTAHKILTFTLQGGRVIGPGSWKMNSSAIKEENFRAEIEEVFWGLEELNVSDSRDWWDLFISIVTGVTLTYTQKRARVKRCLKDYYLARVRDFEGTVDPTSDQVHKYNYYRGCLDGILVEEIRGHEIRTKGLPRYEINEPDIDMYSKFEKRYQSKGVIYQLADEGGRIKTEPEDLLSVTGKYYRALFRKSRTIVARQNKLLGNITRTLSSSDRRSLDRPLTLEELEKAVMALCDGKSPGPDGITAEFYKTFWYLIGERFLDYVNTAKRLGFRALRNTSSTTLVYKHRGELYKLDNYRPIALINVDLKILTKALSNRLRPVLPSIIHRSQTAVDGRRIDHTVHLIRDMVDLINKDDVDGALIFLDQEKAFDRVEHDFLFKTMRAFGIGDSFIDWLRVIYSNATTSVKVNGYLTDPIALERGLRQGCPLSPSLYVLVIEIFALQLRCNENIVGFVVGGGERLLAFIMQMIRRLSSDKTAALRR